jgi:cytidine deaminase
MPLKGRYEDLIAAAKAAMERAYAPYSGFKVGAALRTASGRIFTGCNVENASFGATICAERTAVVKAVSEGEKEFDAIAIVSSSGEVTPPCGICRQVLAEFAEDIPVIMAQENGDAKIYPLYTVFPQAKLPFEAEE